MITQQDIHALCAAARQAGVALESENLELLQWNAGKTHIPLALPANKAAVYIFKWNDIYLKVGKVNASSSPRYQSQHYNPDSSKSNLSRSLLSDAEFQPLIGNEIVGDWIKSNTIRFNVLIPSSLGKNFVHFTEAFFILKCNPRFENTGIWAPRI
jgi:hypothetical protein